MKTKSAEEILTGKLQETECPMDMKLYNPVIEAMHEYASQFKPKWVACEDLPELKKGYSEMVWLYAHVGISLEPYVAYYCESGNVWRQKDNGVVIPRPYMYRLLDKPQLPNENKEE